MNRRQTVIEYDVRPFDEYTIEIKSRLAAAIQQSGKHKPVIVVPGYIARRISWACSDQRDVQVRCFAVDDDFMGLLESHDCETLNDIEINVYHDSRQFALVVLQLKAHGKDYLHFTDEESLQAKAES